MEGFWIDDFNLILSAPYIINGLGKIGEILY